ncbi:histidine triad (HIT) family protein [Motilibacter peucedani]|uniref:Histidine triad (HIT) family protein n=1 Tax=Motilibacter peucedani TaxID=598650 RepID=A0A420XP08_9ACTN|nr:histidine triad nucleotide-binding protein [Motilibacter peucedani]RKS73902.1 histidine triad (HIT) family protein [Motilibacter peucedani]
MTDCLFCRIVAREVPATVVAEDELALAFRDIDPQAPTHVLVVPKVHAPDLAALAEIDPAALAAVGRMVAAVAAQEGAESYRTVFNTGAGAGQTVWHAHAHVLAGRSMQWPPG